MSKASVAGPPAAKAIWRSLGEKRDPVGTAKRAAPKTVQLGKKTADASSAVSRRDFFGAATATAAMVGTTGCLRRPVEHILPHSTAPEYALPGMALHFATSVTHDGEGFGLLVESHEGRPTKIEGNPEHPSSLGATDARLQATILSLYDMDRSAHLLVADGQQRAEKRWSDFDRWWRGNANELEEARGRGLRVLMPPTDSPSMLRARRAFLSRFPEARVHTWSPVHDGALREGARIAFGRPYVTQVDYARTRVIVALDCDFLGAETGRVRAARRFADGRRLLRPTDQMNRLYVLEASLSVTGMNADHRARIKPSQCEGYLKALARKLASLEHFSLPEGLADALGAEGGESGVPEVWVDKVAADLVANRRRSAVVVGRTQPARVHALAHAINVGLQNFGRTVFAVRPPDEDEPEPTSSLRGLVEAMKAGDVKTLVMLGGNPVYDAPHDLGFSDALARVDTSVHLSSHDDETSFRSTWHLPQAHPLESWGDHRALDGTLSIQQPLIAPLRGGRSEAELFAMMAGIRGWRGVHLVRGTLRSRVEGANFERVWRQSLHRGVFVGGTAVRPEVPRLSGPRVAQALRAPAVQAPRASSESSGDWEVVFAPSPQTWDGALANNPWLLEMPEPTTKMVWDNAAWISPTAAAELGVESGDLLSIRARGGEDLTIPAVVLPAHHDRVVTLPLGFGRERAGRYGNGVGFDVYPARTADHLWFAGAAVRKASGHHAVVQTQEHHSMVPAVEVMGNTVKFDPRPIVVEATLEEYRATPNFAQWAEPTPEIGPLWDEVDYSKPRMPAQGGVSYSLIPEQRPVPDDVGPRYKWGLNIDLTTCTGCSACIIACQAENNIAVVGKEQVARGREMHWMRLDRYFVGDDEGNPTVALQPVACQHCEEAPCENVCPVAATAHSPEGLNDMAYNRCIGTRYCMNNCPYKVRRFNFLDYHGRIPELKQMQFNPNVTVRMRGVMEKCSYCVQRIQSARIHARTETAKNIKRSFREGQRSPNWQDVERRIRPEEVTPACAQACPSGALVFGDLNQTSSWAAEQSRLDRHYKLLAAVGAQPRTTYLGKVRNPNPEMG